MQSMCIWLSWVHLTIPIWRHVISSSSQRTCGLVVESLIPNLQDPSSNTSAKKTKKNSRSSNGTWRQSKQSNTWMKALVAQRQSVYNIVGHPTRLSIVRKTDDYRLISGRSQDRNLSGALNSRNPIQKGVHINVAQVHLVHQSLHSRGVSFCLWCLNYAFNIIIIIGLMLKKMIII